MHALETIHAMNAEAVEQHKREAATDPVDALCDTLDTLDALQMEAIQETNRAQRRGVMADVEYWKGRRSAISDVIRLVRETFNR